MNQTYRITELEKRVKELERNLETFYQYQLSLNRDILKSIPSFCSTDTVSDKS